MFWLSPDTAILKHLHNGLLQHMGVVAFKYMHARKKYQSPEQVYDMINTAAGVDYKRNAK